MDDILKEMVEHYQITKLIAEYCHGCDRLDERRMAGVYAADSWDDHGLSKMSGPDFARLSMSSRVSEDDMVSHLMGQTLVRINGDEAGAESYFLATVRRKNEQGEQVLDHMGGRYVDTLVRCEGNWRIKKRITIRDWSTSNPILDDWIGQRNFVAGRTDGQDVSYAALGISHSGPPSGYP